MESSSEVKRSTHVISVQPNETVLTALPYGPHSSLLEFLTVGMCSVKTEVHRQHHEIRQKAQTASKAGQPRRRPSGELKLLALVYLSLRAAMKIKDPACHN